MATIAANITAISNAKSDLADNLTTKGVTSSDTEPLATLVGKVLDITSGGVTITGETTVTGTASENITEGDTVARVYESSQDSGNTALSSALSELPANTSYGCSFSPNADYLALFGIVTAPYMKIYKRNGDAFAKLTNPTVMPTGNCYKGEFSPDGTYLVCPQNYASAYFLWYKRSGDTFTALANPTDMPTGIPFEVSWSPDGVYLAMSVYTSPYLIIYKRTGDTLAKLTNPTDMPTGVGYGCDFSPDGNLLAVAHDASPYLTVYSRSGDTFTKLSTVSTGYNTNGRCVAFSPDGKTLAFGQALTPFTVILNVSGTVIRPSMFADVPTGTTTYLKFSKDGKYLIIGSSVTPYFRILKNVGGIYTTVYTDTVHSTVRYIDTVRDYLVVSHEVSPFTTIYKISNSLSVKKLSNLIENSNLISDYGYATETVASGNTATMKSIVRNPSNYPV